MPARDIRVVKVQKRSGFDKSHRNTLTGKCGTLIPILVDEIIPDTKVNLKINLAASMPPLVSDTYMNVRLRVEAFAVPHRLTQANFEDFFCDYPGRFAYDDKDITEASELQGCMPLIAANSAFRSDWSFSWKSSFRQRGTLYDYVGLPHVDDDFTLYVPSAPLVAYWLIWDNWYRNPRVQTPAFVKPDGQSLPSVVAGFTGESNDVGARVACAPYQSYFFGQDGSQPVFVPVYNDDELEVVESSEPVLLHNGHIIWDLAQRNFGLDFFTAALVEPQQGQMARVTIDGAGDDAGFTIASLRAQNSIQQFRERNGLTSPRYQQQVYARYGCAPSDGIIQRPILIGAATYDVYSHGVTSSAMSVTEGYVDNFNPFSGALGTRAGNGFASGSDFIISGFHAKEPMYIIVLASLVPEVSYSSNTNPLFLRYKYRGSITDMANPILQNVGPEPIPLGMLAGSTDNASEFNSVFAYTDRYSTWMFKMNSIHGHFAYGEDLDSFVLQRFVGAEAEFGNDFLQIPTTYLDDVLQFTTANLGFTYWMDIMFDYKISMPIQEYAIPSLQDPGYEHGRSVVLRKNGQLL